MKGLSLARVAGFAMLTAAAANPAFAQAKTLTVSWWGYNGEKMKANIIEPFKKICGCEVVFETGNNADRLNKLKLRGGKGVDVIYLTDSYSQLGIQQGLFQEVDRSKLPNLADLYDIAKAPQGNYGPAYTIGRIGIVYDTAKLNPPITSWNDLWRDDLKGAISLPGITTTGGPLTVLQAGKHAGADPYADADKAFEAIEALKPNVVKNYNTGSELVNLISTGEAKVAITQDFVLSSLRSAVPTMAWADLKEGDIAVLNTVNIPKGSENVELAHQFINFILSKDVQQAEAEQGVDAPVSTKVVLPAEKAKLWTYGAEMIAKLSRIDYQKLIEAQSDWVDRWNEIFGM
ncbi:putative spermidine/putrescine transport system substrate-binding protein [Rhizobium sp. BK347]|nr:putative spermidine/putrescine transport system substrate-binding protein [Rhizobium sp. BK252]MBB3406051.1 putative spermidine/putrescine transport system substrate-binding protein [Rhizobium sp. BK289]MBB3418620.1 putative spermidine/putrescine transport system substrate-binding protein [Rhizobium sp. BK284]MBB3486515.1 putative spermidine/putrescine transport system substrate-binding protein [Rhizobium sp. BK347]